MFDRKHYPIEIRIMYDGYHVGKFWRGHLDDKPMTHTPWEEISQEEKDKWVASYEWVMKTIRKRQERDRQWDNLEPGFK